MRCAACASPTRSSVGTRSAAGLRSATRLVLVSRLSGLFIPSWTSRANPGTRCSGCRFAGSSSVPPPDRSHRTRRHHLPAACFSVAYRNCLPGGCAGSAGPMLFSTSARGRHGRRRVCLHRMSAPPWSTGGCPNHHHRRDEISRSPAPKGSCRPARPWPGAIGAPRGRVGIESIWAACRP